MQCYFVINIIDISFAWDLYINYFSGASEIGTNKNIRIYVKGLKISIFFVQL